MLINIDTDEIFKFSKIHIRILVTLGLYTIAYISFTKIDVTIFKMLNGFYGLVGLFSLILAGITSIFHLVKIFPEMC